MERIKGKLKIDRGYLISEQDKIIATATHTNGFPTEQQQANAEHIKTCWNAFEPGGLVGELVGALERTDILMGDVSPEFVKQVLAKAKEVL